MIGIRRITTIQGTTAMLRHALLGALAALPLAAAAQSAPATATTALQCERLFDARA